MSRKCTICDHPKREAINRMGESAAEVARRYHVSPDAVKRHRKHLISHDVSHDKSESHDTARITHDELESHDVSHDDTRPGYVDFDAAVHLDISAPVRVPHVVMVPDYDISVQSDDDLGEANLQDQAERQFRNGWNLMNEARREKNLDWLRQQLPQDTYAE